MTQYSMVPGSHRDRGVLAAKHARLREPHIAPITAFVDDLMARTGTKLPYVDPDGGGVRARVLCLLASPGGSAAERSGLLSVDNTGPTARNLWAAYRDTGLPRDWAVHWNAVPWFTRSIPETVRLDPEVWLARFLGILPALCIIVALGDRAASSLVTQMPGLVERRIAVVYAPMPSRGEINKRADEVLGRLHSAFEAARVIAASEPRPAATPVEKAGPEPTNSSARKPR
jgi:hypothetical protein